MSKLQKVLKDLKPNQTDLIINPKKVIGGTSHTRPLTGMYDGAQVSGG